jgi:phospholipid/cholesterol/gamma-HCH transport system substrate-binding protein
VNVSLLVEKDERFKNLLGKTALFVALAVLGIGLTFLWNDVKKGAFTTKSSVHFVADSGQDLSEGMPVKFSGFKIGKLNTLALDEQGHVQVTVYIETNYLKLIRQDAVMSLKKEGVIGDGILNISHGSDSKPVLKDGAKVLFARTNGLEQAVVELKDRIVPVLDDVHLILSDPNGDVRQSLKNLRQITAEIKVFASEMHETRQRIDHVLVNADKLVGNADSNLNNGIAPLLRSLRQSAENAEMLTAKLNHDLPALFLKADSGVESLRMSSQTINNAIQKSAPLLPGIFAETSDTVGSARKMIGTTNEVVDAVSSSWPLNKMVPAPETGPVRMSSHD